MTPEFSAADAVAANAHGEIVPNPLDKNLNKSVVPTTLEQGLNRNDLTGYFD
ncbi:MAG: hypothetical protein SCM96_12000 [Acidobacteriota bacterium]|nr:hypothetical protein [Acidobacteriota bacterium]